MKDSNKNLERLRSEYKESDDNLDSGTKLAQYCSDMGWYNEAVKTYKELLTKYPNNYSLVLDYGNLCFKMNDIKEASKCFKKLTILKPAKLEGWNNLGISQLMLEDFDSAKKSFSKVLDIEPDNSGALLNMGNYYDRVGDTDKAISFFKRAVEVRMDFPDAWFNLGNAYIKIGNIEKAKRSYKKALKYSPDFTSALKNLGYAYEVDNDLSNAEKYYKTALELNKVDASIYVNIANILTKQQEYDKAKDNFIKAVKLAPKDASGWLGLRHLSLLKGNIKSYVDATMAIIHRLDDAAIAESILKLRELNYLKGAGSIIKALDREDRAGNEIDAERLVYYSKTGTNTGKVLIIYKKLMDLKNKSDSITACLAEYEFSNKRYKNCIDLINKMKTKRRSINLLFWISLIKTNDLDTAESSIRLYLQDNPDYFDAWFWLAVIETNLDRNTNARKDLIKALETGFTNLSLLDEYPSLKKIYDTFK